MQQHRRNGHDLRRVAVGPVGGGMPAAVEDAGAVDRDLDPADEAGHEHRPGLVALARRPLERQRENLRSVCRRAWRLVIGQADGMASVACAEHRFGQQVAFATAVAAAA